MSRQIVEIDLDILLHDLAAGIYLRNPSRGRRTEIDCFFVTMGIALENQLALNVCERVIGVSDSDFIIRAGSISFQMFSANTPTICPGSSSYTGKRK